MIANHIKVSTPLDKSRPEAAEAVRLWRRALSNGVDPVKRIGLIGLMGLIGLIVVPASAEAGIKPPPSNLGLVGYWSMNDCRFTSSTDSSGSGNTGSLTNFALSGSTSNWVTGNAAKRGCALNFDGSNDNVTIGDANSLDLTTTGTLSAWVKVTTFATDGASNRRIISKQNNVADNEIYGLLTESTQSRFELRLNGNGNNLYTTTTNLATGRWYHLVGTWDGTNARIYVNGAQDNIVAQSTPSATTKNLLIGNWGATTGQGAFSGSLDDVRIYNRALTATEVTALYNSGSAKLTAPSNNGLVGYWSMDDCRGSSSTDSSGNRNTGSLTNFALSTSTSNWVTGNAAKRGCALNFDGVDDRVNIGAMTGSVPFTMSFWARRNAIPQTYAVPLALGANNTTNFVAAFNEAGDIIYGNPLVSYATWAAGWKADSAFHHVVIVANSTTTATLYFDGANKGTLNAASTDIWTTPKIGIRSDGSSATPFSGAIDEVRIYNRALSPAEVTSLYNSGAVKINASTASLQQGTNLASGLVGHWTFDGQYLNTTTSTDTSGSNNNGTLTGANGKPIPTAGKLGQALSFDGVDDYVETGNLSQINSVSGFTYSAWVYRTGAPSSYTGIVSRKEGAPAVPSTDLLLKTPSDIFFRVGVDQNSFGYTSSALIAINEWHHVVGVFDGSGSSNTDKLKIYVDGAQQSITTASTAPTSAPSMTANLTIGFYNQTPFYFPGKIDDVRVYNRALSASEVLQLYNLGR